MNIPHITIEQAKIAFESVEDKLMPALLERYNSRIDAYNKANPPESNLKFNGTLPQTTQSNEQPFISAEEARKLGAGKAEVLEQDGKWRVCGIKCQYPSSHFFGEHKYRAVKQPKPVEPHAEPMLKLSNELIDKHNARIDKAHPPVIDMKFRSKLPESESETIRVVISNQHEPCKKEPQTELKANLVKLGGKLMTREAAIAKWEAVKDKCDVWIKNDVTVVWELTNLSRKFIVYAHEVNCEYQLRAKPLKQVSWKDVPVGVAVQSVNKKHLCNFVGMAANGLISVYNTMAGANNYRAAKFELAPASEQPWIAVQNTFEKVEGLIYETKADAGFCTSPRDIAAFRITGLAEGYELK